MRPQRSEGSFQRQLEDSMAFVVFGLTKPTSFFCNDEPNEAYEDRGLSIRGEKR